MLTGANANLINAETELLAAKINFERVTREKLPDFENLNEKIILNLPNSVNSSLELSSLNNLNLLISKINHGCCKRSKD